MNQTGRNRYKTCTEDEKIKKYHTSLTGLSHASLESVDWTCQPGSHDYRIGNVQPDGVLARMSVVMSRHWIEDSAGLAPTEKCWRPLGESA